MRCLLLAVFSFCACLALASDPIEGEIALSAPQCDLFVVQTGRDFSLLRQDSYYGVFEGDHVSGQLHDQGPDQVQIVGEVTIGVTIEDTGLTLEQAKAIFYPRCRKQVP
jgi:hypothetical protein